MKSLLLILCVFGFLGQSWGQEVENEKVSEKEIEEAIEKGNKVVSERPFNTFISAGINVYTSDIYNVAVSPIDNTVQFEKVSRLNSGISMGLVWNPLRAPYKVYEYKGKTVDWHYEYKRKAFAVALLLNVFRLSFGEEQANSTTPIDVGFGLGYRKNNFLLLFTTEFTPIRQPRKYFIDGYKEKDLPLIMANSNEPVKTISTDDNSLFITRLIPSVGLKIAYAFGERRD